MSEALEKVSEIKTLPIFPLPLVLLPNELVPLHIFEPRYRQMVDDITPAPNLFGLTRFEPADEFLTRPAPGTVGCSAEIRDRQALDDGRSNIVASGVVRYRLIEFIENDKEYLTASVEFFEDDEADESLLRPLAAEVFSVFERVAKAAFKLSGNRGRFPEIPPADPEKLSFLVAAAFNLENELKYELVSMSSTLERLERLLAILRQSVGQMEASAEIQGVSQTNGHSKKKIDLG